MKYLFPVLAVISCLTAHPQKNELPAGSKQIFIAFNFSPDYNSRLLVNNGGDSFADQLIRTRNEREMGKFGFTTGLSFCISMKKLLGFEAGIQYSRKGYQTKKYDLVYQPPDPALPVKAKYIYNYDYIDIPLKVNMTLGKNKVRFISSAGFAINFLLNATDRVIYDYANGNTTEQDQPSSYDFKKINISPLISAGAECKIKNNMYVRIEPTFRYQLLKNIDKPITEHLWNLGLNAGFYYSIHRSKRSR